MIYALVITLLVSCGGCETALPAFDLSSAMRRAQQERKLVLVEFSRIGCSYTTKMDLNVFPDAEVKREMRDFVRIRLDTGVHADEAKRWNVTITPTFLVARANGSILRRYDGPMGADAFRRFLIRAKITQ